MVLLRNIDRINEEDRVVLRKGNAIVDYDSITMIQSDGSWIQMGHQAAVGWSWQNSSGYVPLPYRPSMLNPSAFTMLFCGLFITIGIKWNAILTPKSIYIIFLVKNSMCAVIIKNKLRG